MSLTTRPTTVTTTTTTTMTIGRRFRTAAIAATIAAAVLLSGCAGTGYHYVKSSENHTYFKVPDSWKLYGQQELLKRSSLTTDQKQQELATTWEAAFDGDPSPSVAHIGSKKPAFPVGIATVQKLSSDVADGVSLQALRNFFVSTFDDAVTAKTAQVISYDPVNLNGGFRGSHLVAHLARGKVTLTMNQVVVVDQATSKIYGLLVICTSTCYDTQQAKIEKVVDSWTVKDN